MDLRDVSPGPTHTRAKCDLPLCGHNKRTRRGRCAGDVAAFGVDSDAGWFVPLHRGRSRGAAPMRVRARHGGGGLDRLRRVSVLVAELQLGKVRVGAMDVEVDGRRDTVVEHEGVLVERDQSRREDRPHERPDSCP
jgi:hypothetical protein